MPERPPRNRPERIGVVGATGAVGTVTLSLLAARGYERVRAFASARSAGASIPFGGRELVVEPDPLHRVGELVDDIHDYRVGVASGAMHGAVEVLVVDTHVLQAGAER